VATAASALPSDGHDPVSEGAASLPVMDDTPRIVAVGPDNVIGACRLAVRPEQEDYVAPVAVSLAEAYANPDTAWPRLIYHGDALVGFVMGGFDPGSPVDFFRCGIWRLNIAAAHQGNGYGRFAVRAVLDEARRRGEPRATVLWKPGADSPEGFYLKMGFRPTGEEFHGQVVGELFLDQMFAEGSPAPVDGGD
jgi:diamine N-acetyltransferase